MTPIDKILDLTMAGASLSTTATVTANLGVVACQLAGESALLDLDSSRYYRLNAVGTHIWTMLETPRSVGELHAAVIKAFDVDADRCIRDIDALLGELSKAGLVTVTDAQAI